jgi:hypothetical protein
MRGSRHESGGFGHTPGSYDQTRTIGAWTIDVGGDHRKLGWEANPSDLPAVASIDTSPADDDDAPTQPVTKPSTQAECFEQLANTLDPTTAQVEGTVDLRSPPVAVAGIPDNACLREGVLNAHGTACTSLHCHRGRARCDPPSRRCAVVA